MQTIDLKLKGVIAHERILAKSQLADDPVKLGSKLGTMIEKKSYISIPNSQWPIMESEYVT